MAAQLMQFNRVETALFVVWLTVIFWPLYYSFRHKTSFALSMTVGLLLGYLVQVIWSLFYNFGFVDLWLWEDLWMRPTEAKEPSGWITFISAGFLHSQFDATHVLGNIMVIALVGIPLEQRLGRNRFFAVYFIGLIGGSFAWFLFNIESSRPALGASGAAFGLFGAYLAGWPKDEIPFPLILIRKWPVFYLALIYFGLEVFRAYSTYGLERPSDVGHMAHLGGFILAYVTLPLVAKGGPVPLGVEDGGPSSSSEVINRLRSIKKQMKDLNSAEDPWTAQAYELPKNVRESVKSLMDSSDEPETRQAWMEHIADLANCPQCASPLGVIERSDGPHIQCSSNPEHFNWP
ncbi:MAG: rhomboid family intramembrane serine protease [Candidatus Poseidoniaceae archaeon]|nr:rhomboid family intramembrane serine protease [Candidatus Poseidoniaceae archaeon]MBL6896654.1 rhomboid family intramembrane serine protease [Candidatus Poseidoniaceae archaeon]